MSLLDAVLAGILPPGVYELDEGESAVDARLDSQGWAAIELDLRDATERADLFGRCATAFRFPDWVGNNLDALADALSDLSWLAAQGFVVVVDAPHTPTPWWDDLLSVLVDSCDEWAGSRTPMWVLIRG